MKKVFLFVVAAATLTLAACGNQTEKAAEAADSTMALTGDPIEALQSALGSQSFDKVQALLNQAGDYLANLSDEEKAAYVSKLQQFVEQNKAALEAASINTTTVSSLIEAVKDLPTSVSGLAGEAKDAAQADAQQAVEDVKAAASAKVDEVKTQATEKVEAAKTQAVEKANVTVDKAMEKSNATVDAAATKANDAAAKAVNNAASKLKLGK